MTWDWRSKYFSNIVDDLEDMGTGLLKAFDEWDKNINLNAYSIKGTTIAYNGRMLPDGIEYEFELAGHTQADVDVLVRDGRLIINATRTIDGNKSTKSITIQLIPIDLYDTETITARMNNGLLTVKLPYRATNQVPGKKIDIQIG